MAQPAAHFDASQTGSLSAADQAFPGLTLGLANYVGVATGTVTIPAGALTQTFGVNSREGFSLTFTGQTFSGVSGGDAGNNGTSTMSYSSNRLPGDTLGTITFPAASNYTFTLEWYGNTSGSEVELYSAPTTTPLTSWAAGGTNWHLLGDIINGGLPLASNANVTIYKSTGAVTSLSDANNVVANSGLWQWTKTDSPAYINYLTAGIDGHFNYTAGGTLPDAANGSAAILANSPTVYWQFNETSGNTANNSATTGSAYNASLNTTGSGSYNLGAAGPTGASAVRTRPSPSTAALGRIWAPAPLTA